MSFDMADEEDGKDDHFLEMSHCGLGHNQGLNSRFHRNLGIFFTHDSLSNL